MGIAVAVQLRQLVFFCFVGAALALGYDLLRLFFRCGGLRAVGDGLFAAAVLLALFGFGQRTAERAFYLYMAAGAALGFGLWWRFVSPSLRRQLALLGRRVAASVPAQGAKKAALWLKKSALALFSSGAKCVTMALRKTARTPHARAGRQTAYEAAQGKHPNTARHRGAAGLRRRAYRADAGQAGRGAKSAKRAGSAGDGA